MQEKKNEKIYVIVASCVRRRRELHRLKKELTASKTNTLV